MQRLRYRAACRAEAHFEATTTPRWRVRAGSGSRSIYPPPHGRVKNSREIEVPGTNFLDIFLSRETVPGTFFILLSYYFFYFFGFAVKFSV
jgi:hypothetical protein